MLKHNKQTLLEYVKKLGAAEAEGVSWKGATSSRRADVADIITMAFRGDLSETAFFAFSMNTATNVVNAAAGGASASLPSQPLVLLRSKTALQKQLIAALYGGA